MKYRELIINNLDKILNLYLLIDSKNNIVYCSQMASHHLGYGEEELLQKPVSTIIADGIPDKETLFDRLMIDNYRGTVVNQRSRFKLKNGVIIDIELSIHNLEETGEKYKLISFVNTTEVVEIRKVVNAKAEMLHEKYHMFEKEDINDSIRDVIDAILVSITAGQGLKFNRAFLFFVNKEQQELRGVKAIGPGSGEEAGIIYGDFDRTPKTLTEMIEHYKILINPDNSVNELIKRIRISLSDKENILIKVLNNQKHLLINDRSSYVNNPSVIWLREILKVHECIISPLIWHGRSTGLIIADNQVTKTEINNLDIKSLTRFSATASTTIESAKLMNNLDRSLTQIRQANIKIKASQTILLQKEKLAAMGELVAHMAHEVRGPLVTIGGFAARMRKKLGPENEHYDAVSRIVETVNTLEMVINDILDGSIPEKEPIYGCDCTKAINKVVKMLEEEIHRRKVSVNLNIQGNLPKISIKEHQLFEILNNLVKNALESIEEEGLLIILANSMDNKVMLTIQDTGKGIAPEH
ncbi:PAS domain S-box protein, partial [bacterium]|nr:PAS domain S-box protein [bacterium]